ncbi:MULTISPECIES: type II toxin-antitoxin system VapC family toxin [Microbacterium]|uniref:type II toxin-antitoxin system VapC family toxin n=1 Tax=Microbacterium TaxID=33882 RepID=UPI0022EFF362|nr:type II toxin-antitoxin system VapC family toxin [Streptomyces sp. MS2A]
MRILYIDTSALMKRVVAEDESDFLADALRLAVNDAATLMTSRLAEVEVSRALRSRFAGDAADHAVPDALSGVGVAPITDVVLAFARTLEPPVVRTLDAIHLATAIALGAHEVWTYDDRFAEGARRAGIAVQMHGRRRHE